MVLVPVLLVVSVLIVLLALMQQRHIHALLVNQLSSKLLEEVLMLIKINAMLAPKVVIHVPLLLYAQVSKRDGI